MQRKLVGNEHQDLFMVNVGASPPEMEDLPRRDYRKSGENRR
jgi:hypothetical protein